MLFLKCVRFLIKRKYKFTFIFVTVALANKKTKTNSPNTNCKCIRVFSEMAFQQFLKVGGTTGVALLAGIAYIIYKL